MTTQTQKPTRLAQHPTNQVDTLLGARLDWIIHATEFFINAIEGSNFDKTEGVNLAIAAFNNGASAASAIYQGFDLIRRRANQARYR